MKEILLTIVLLAISITTTTETPMPAEEEYLKIPVKTKTAESSDEHVPIPYGGNWKWSAHTLYSGSSPCIAGSIYSPSHDQCYQSHSRGPCSPGQILITEHPNTNPKCIKNPCREGYVQMTGPGGKKKCYRLYKEAPELCKSSAEGEQQVILTINPTTFQPDCLPIRISLYHLIDVPPNKKRNGR